MLSRLRETIRGILMSDARKALNYLVGEVLKRTNYKADPAVVKRLMIEQLNKRQN